MIIAPSVLALDYSKMSEQVYELNRSDAEWLHFDVMDGHFVPNLTFGPDILKGFCKLSNLFMDVHLMVSDPEFFGDVFIKAGANLITFHLEAMNSEEEVKNLAKHLRQCGVLAGLSINPDTPVECLKPYLNDFDLFLIMSVQPGFGGQSFRTESVEKISTLRSWLDELGLYKVHIEVDGGINQETVKAVKKAGADVVVAGSYVFKNNIIEAVKSLE